MYGMFTQDVCLILKGIFVFQFQTVTMELPWHLTGSSVNFAFFDEMVNYEKISGDLKFKISYRDFKLVVTLD